MLFRSRLKSFTLHEYCSYLAYDKQRIFHHNNLRLTFLFYKGELNTEQLPRLCGPSARVVEDNVLFSLMGRNRRIGNNQFLIAVSDQTL